jgi:ATP-dependent DNA helicase RecG
MELKVLIAECTAYDFKVMLEEKKPKSWLKSVSAFANGLGGSLFFGIDNDGVVKGLDDVQHVCEAISSRIRDYMDPLPDVEMIPHDIDGLHILQLKVNAGHYTPYYYVGDGQRIAYVRIGDESLPATAEQMVRLVLKGSNKTFDSLRTDYKAEDYSFTILANSFKDRTKQEWDKKYLLSFGLVTGTGNLTNAGALFADDCPLWQSRLYCTRWNGMEKGDAINDAEFIGNILLLLREAMAFVKANTRKGWEKLPDGRKNKPEYAERAVLEALVNHFIHRDYMVMGSEVHLDIYDDRLAITSPGGMYSGQIVQDLPLEEISSDRRNPILADVMAQLDYMEKRGSGLKRICNETKALDGYKEELKPVFKSTTSQFMTTIYSMEYEPKDQQNEQNQTGMKQGLSWEQVGTKTGLSWDEVAKLFIALQEPKSMSELKELYRWSNTTKFKAKYVRPLIEAQFVDMTLPNKPTSPNQKYYLTDLGKALFTYEMKETEDMENVNDKVRHMILALNGDEKRIALELLKGIHFSD